MDKARDASRRHFSKRPELAGGEVLAPDKTRKERFQRLSLVGRGNSSFPHGVKSMGPSDDGLNREKELRTVAGRKRFKLPRKFLEDCTSVKQASVPRKLRSAMKKRSRESISPPISDSKKPKYSLRGGESPIKDGSTAKKTKKKRKSEKGISGTITKDEEEVVETLYALAGMFLNNNDTCNSGKADEESTRADTSALPGGTSTSTYSACEATEELKLSAPSYNEDRLPEETMRTHSPDVPNTCQQPDLLECKLFSNIADNRPETDLQATPSHSQCEKRNPELLASCNFGHAAELTLDARENQPEKMEMLLPLRKKECREVVVGVYGNQVHLHHKIEDSRNNGPVLWPGLLAASVSPHDSGPLQFPASKIPAWLDSAACSTKPGAIQSGILIKKVPRSRVSKISRKKCVKHVFISHLIETLQLPESKDKLLLQPNSGRQHEEAEQFENTVEPNCKVFKDSLTEALASRTVFDSQRSPYETRNASVQQDRHSQGTKFSLTGNEGFDFLSLFTPVRGINQKHNPPYIYSVARRQHISVPLTTSRTYNSYSYPDELTGMTASQQVQLQQLSYLGNLGRSFLQRGSMVVPKEQHHQQQILWAWPIESTQCKPTGNLKAVSQFPTWQNERMESPALVPFAAIIPPPSASGVEVLGPMHSQLLAQQHILHNHNHHHHHQQQQQQIVSLRSSFIPTTGKGQDNFPRSVLEETVPSFQGGGSLSLQLLCNERL